MLFPVKHLADLGFTIVATSGTSDVLRRNGITSEVVRKISERRDDDDPTPTITERITNGEIAMVVNTPTGQAARADGYAIRAAANVADVTLITTVQELSAAVQAIEAQRGGQLTVKSLQEHARDLDLYGVRTAPGEAR
jgi:carbamoyl-phosphate synthase large subunit